MTEEDLEVEIVPKNELQVLINKSGLEQSKAQFMLEQFTDHYKMAAEWAKKAKTIIVTNESQTVNMKAARTGRLFLREKRLEIESARKSLKESALREGKAIDMIANFLKDLIIPTEEHLDRQEHFVEYKKKAEDERILAEAHAKLEVERIEKEKLESEEREKLRAENEKLRKEKEEAERKIRKIKQEEMQKEAEIIKLKTAPDLDKMKKFYADLMAIEFPEVTSQDAKRIIFDSKSHIGIAAMSTNKYIQSTVQEEEV